MKKLLIMAFAASAFAACCNNGGVACDARNLDRAKATLDSIYAHYGVAENRLLRENYPFNVDYTASYLASADQARPNPYSYLDRKSTRLNSSHPTTSRMPSSA